jgi:hypothetical protein
LDDRPSASTVLRLLDAPGRGRGGRLASAELARFQGRGGQVAAGHDHPIGPDRAAEAEVDGRLRWAERLGGDFDGTLGSP